MSRIFVMGFLFVSLAISGCSDSGTRRQTPSSGFVAPGSQVMTEDHRKQTVDHMVKQGANRAEADAFTKTLNKAQSEWEAKK